MDQQSFMILPNRQLILYFGRIILRKANFIQPQIVSYHFDFPIIKTTLNKTIRNNQK